MDMSKYSTYINSLRNSSVIFWGFLLALKLLKSILMLIKVSDQHFLGFSGRCTDILHNCPILLLISEKPVKHIVVTPIVLRRRMFFL